MLIIFGWSTDVGSTQHTRSFIVQILHSIPLLHNNLTDKQIDGLDYAIRKCAHITEYTILATLAYRAIRLDRKTFRDIWLWGPILLCILYASSDEWHQSFVKSRFPAVGDVLYDTFGGMVGTVLNLWRYLREVTKNSRSNTE